MVRGPRPPSARRAPSTVALRRSPFPAARGRGAPSRFPPAGEREAPALNLDKVRIVTLLSAPELCWLLGPAEPCQPQETNMDGSGFPAGPRDANGRFAAGSPGRRLGSRNLVSKRVARAI